MLTYDDLQKIADEAYKIGVSAQTGAMLRGEITGRIAAAIITAALAGAEVRPALLANKRKD